MKERPTPDRELDYQEVRRLYGRTQTLFNMFQNHSDDVEIHKRGNTIEIIKPIANLPEGENAWLSLMRVIDGTTHLLRASVINQSELEEAGRHAMKADVTTYSFLMYNSGSLNPIHSSKWSQQKELGVHATPTVEHGALLEVEMSRAAVIETAQAAPILQEDLPDIEAMLADWR